jgi:hypothetical protein
VIRNRTAEIVAELEAAWPKWHVWVVFPAYGNTIWCAHRRDDERHVLNTDSPDELAWEIEQESS